MFNFYLFILEYFISIDATKDKSFSAISVTKKTKISRKPSSVSKKSAGEKSTKSSKQSDKSNQKSTVLSKNDSYEQLESVGSKSTKPDFLDNSTKSHEMSDDGQSSNHIVVINKTSEFSKSRKRPFTVDANEKCITENKKSETKIPNYDVDSSSSFSQTDILKNENLIEKRRRIDSFFDDSDNDLNFSDEDTLLSQCLKPKYARRYSRCRKDYLRDEICNFFNPLNEFCSDFIQEVDQDFMNLLLHNSRKDFAKAKSFESLVTVLNNRLMKDESSLKKYDSSLFKNRMWKEETHPKVIETHCPICCYHELKEQLINTPLKVLKKNIDKITVNLLRKSLNFSESLKVILDDIFTFLFEANSFDALFTKEFIDMHQNFNQLISDDMINVGLHFSDFKIKNQLLHNQFHIFIQQHHFLKKIILPEFYSLLFLFQKKNVFAKIKNCQTFILLYYSLVCTNLFFEALSKSNEISTFYKNKKKINNYKLIITTISTTIRILFIQPMITCSNLGIDSILKYSYLTNQFFLFELKYTLGEFTDKIYPKYIKGNISLILTLDFYVESSYFLEIFECSKFSNRNRIFLWFRREKIEKFTSFCMSFSSIHPTLLKKYYTFFSKQESFPSKLDMDELDPYLHDLLQFCHLPARRKEKVRN